MLYYIKTTIPTKTVEYFTRYYLNTCLLNTYNYNLNNYMKANYKIDLKSLLKNLGKHCKVNSIGNYMFQVYFDKNVWIDNFKLVDILSLLEFGNLDIQPPKIISKAMNNALTFVKFRLGGV